MRVGVFGGTFDPPHTGHLLASADAFDELKLDRLLVIPASTQPLKSDAPPPASPAHRLAMVRCAFGGDPRFEVSSMEIDRGGLSYTVDTLEAVSAEYRGAALVLLLGLDALASFHRWNNPTRIRELAELAVLLRDGEGFMEAAPQPSPDDSVQELLAGVNPVTTRRIDLSSSEIRDRVRKGRSIKGFVPESVERYISAAELYR